MISEIHTGSRGGIYYKQDMYSFLFTLSVVLIALALSYLVFHGREHTTIGRFIIYCSVNLTTIYVIQWLLIIYGFLFMMIIGSELISLEAVICGTADRFGALDTLPHRGWVPPWRRAQLGARFVRNEEVTGSTPLYAPLEKQRKINGFQFY